ncbi:hypothetical protein [Streptomyces coeruleorubidus]|uniref:hypothetical protein n=1 Tax=Streptomyces coeruleorubidus TaxID=116188 RepID=UPI0033C7A9D2
MRSKHALRARTADELTALTADLPAAAPIRSEQDRKDLREWLAEWRYWLGGAVIMSGDLGHTLCAEGRADLLLAGHAAGCVGSRADRHRHLAARHGRQREGDGGRTVAR